MWQKGHIKPQSLKLKGKQWVARAQIKDLIEEDKELSESPTNRAPNDALEESTYPQEGEEDLKNNSGDDEEDKPNYEWDEQEYKANFFRFINEEPIIDTTIRIAAGNIDEMVERVYDHHQIQTIAEMWWIQSKIFILGNWGCKSSLSDRQWLQRGDDIPQIH